MTRDSVLSLVGLLLDHFRFPLLGVYLRGAPNLLQLRLRLLRQNHILLRLICPFNAPLDAVLVQILFKTEHVNFYRISDTLACLGLVSDFEPRLNSEVDSLCYVEARVEARVIACGSGDDEFAWSVADFTHSDTLFQQVFWMNQRSLMPQEFTTILRFLRKLRLNIIFKLLIAVNIDPIPVFRRPIMQIVNRGQVHVLLVPGEHTFPHADVHVAGGDAS